MPFNCSICETESTQICTFCTKDTCANHLCPRCLRCSDCCTCEVALDEPEHHENHARPMVRTSREDAALPEDDNEDGEEEDPEEQHAPHPEPAEENNTPAA